MTPCSHAAQPGRANDINCYTQTFSSVIPDIDTIQIKNVEALPINNATGTCAGPVTTIPTPTPTAYSPPNATHAPTPTTGDCGKYYVVEWLLKVIPMAMGAYESGSGHGSLLLMTEERCDPPGRRSQTRKPPPPKQAAVQTWHGQT